MTDLDRDTNFRDTNFDLDRRLQRCAADLNLPLGNLERVTARTRARRRHQQAFIATTMAVLLVAVVSRVELNGPGSRPVTVQPAAAPNGAAALKAGNIGVVWQHVDPHSALGNVSSVAAGGSLYALSTAPGVTDTNGPTHSQLYRSTDGVEWATAAGPAGTYLSDLAASGDQLYAVGTGAATASPYVVDSSADGGASWQKLPLPVDLGSLQASMLDPQSGTIQVASTGHGVVVVAQVPSELDVTKYLPAGVTAPNGWVLTATGVDLLGPINQPACPAGTNPYPPGKAAAVAGGSPNTAKAAAIYAQTAGVPAAGAPAAPGPVEATECFSASGQDPTPSTVVAPEANHPVTHTFTWAQLGVGTDLVHAATGQPFVFFAPTGGAFRAVSLPNSAGSLGDVGVTAGTDSFAISAAAAATNGGPSEELLWQSQDGIGWTATPALPADVGYPSAIGYLSGRLVAVGSGPTDKTTGAQSGGPTLATLTESGWTEASLASLLGALPTGATVYPASAAVGPFGIVVDVTVMTDPIAQSGGVTVSNGGYTLHVLNDQWAAQVTDASGGVVASTSSLRMGSDQLHLDKQSQAAVLSDSTGKTLATFDGVLAQLGARTASSPNPGSDHLLVSRDGATWSNQGLDQLAGRSGGAVANIAVLSNRFVVTTEFPSGGATGPAPETVLVGAAG